MTRVYQKRLVDFLIDEVLAALPTVSLLGPRAAGKTTTGLRHARAVVRLDRAEEAAAFRSDPDAALRSLHTPVLLDEWQEVPGVLGAVKRASDAEHTPGCFILTGSVHAELDAATWPGTGRVIDVPIGTLTMRELVGDVSAKSFLDRIIEETLDLPSRIDGVDLCDYLDAAVAGGFPEAVFLPSPQLRRRWFTTYIRQLVSRDVLHVAPGRGDARYLAWLRDELKDQFVRGIALHTGRNRWTLDERIEAVPIAAIWS